MTNPSCSGSSSSSRCCSSTECHRGEFLFECGTCSGTPCARHLEIHCYEGLRFTLEQSKLKPTRSGIIPSKGMTTLSVSKHRFRGTYGCGPSVEAWLSIDQGQVGSQLHCIVLLPKHRSLILRLQTLERQLVAKIIKYRQS
jgi:hypothetical protein